MLHYVQFGEGLLQDLKIIQVLVVKLSLPVNFGERDFARVYEIK